MIIRPKHFWPLGMKNIDFGCWILDNLSSVYYLQTRTVKRISLDETSGKKTLYDILGVSSKATQTEIKSAYYTQSLACHPDKHSGDEKAALRFREITEAYEVLGSHLNRRKYDKGLWQVGDNQFAEDNMDSRPESEFYKRQFKSRVPTPSGRTSAYNFDEWTKAHYGKTFQEYKEHRERTRERIRYNEAAIDKRVSLLFLLFAFMSFGMGSFVLYDRRNYDSPDCDNYPST